MRRVAIVGRGLAGAAAAWAAKEAGATVTTYGGPGIASGLTSGAADDEPWERASQVKSLDERTASFFAALGGWSFPDQRSALVATTAGVLREARGHDAFVLDLAGLEHGTVALPRLSRPSWDADHLAASFTDEAVDRGLPLRFVAVDLPWLRFEDEAVLPDADLAARLLDPSRRAFHVDRLRAWPDRAHYVGLLAPAGLGLASNDSPGLLALGEVLSGPGGPAGRRLVAALDRLQPPSRAPTVLVESTRGGLLVRLGHGETTAFDAIVLATGGVLAGGLVLERTDPAAILSPIPTFHAPAFPDGLVSAHRAGEAASHPLGSLAWSRTSGGPLEAVGVLHRDLRVLATREKTVAGLFVAGDAAARRPRTVLRAVIDGIAAGAGAARE